MSRKQFTFYESFFEALERIRKNSDRAAAYDAICKYALRGEEPDLDAMSDAAAIAFHLIKPVLDAGRQKAISGKQGGTAKRKQSKPQAESKRTPREKENEDEKEKEGEIENECYLPTPLRGERKQSASVPDFQQVLEEAKRQGCPDLARPFFDYYNAGGWRDSEGRPVRSWQQKLTAWRVREDDKLRKILTADQGPKRISWAELAREMGGKA